MRVTESRSGRSATGGRGRGRSAGANAPGRSSSAAQSSSPGRDGSCTPAPRARVASRQSQRDCTVGAPSRRPVCSSTTSGAQAAWAKSCALRPTRRSGGGRPSAARIGRDRNGSCGAPCGHTPSSSPARTSRSALTRRDSRAPRIFRRGWAAPAVRTVSWSSRRCSRRAKSAGRASGRPSDWLIRAAISWAAASPSGPAQRPPGRPAASAARASAASASPRAASAGVALPPV